MSNSFTPKNVVQRLAQENRGIESLTEFHRAIAVKPWKVGRLTARNWWLEGITKGMRLSGAITLADFLKVKVDDLIEKKG
jgi:hypothetical protein